MQGDCNKIGTARRPFPTNFFRFGCRVRPAYRSFVLALSQLSQRENQDGQRTCFLLPPSDEGGGHTIYTFPEPPLCKGRWVAVRRPGGVDAVKCCVIRLISGIFAAFYRSIPQSRLTPRQLHLHKGALNIPHRNILK